jgi:hypothetical protein
MGKPMQALEGKRSKFSAAGDARHPLLTGGRRGLSRRARAMQRADGELLAGIADAPSTPGPTTL